MKYKVSICVPTYNGASYLTECLDSILSQTFSDFELLIVDDQSSDETFLIAEQYSKKDSRIRIYQNSRNLGLVGNWNKCIELAKGEWIKFVFQDDYIAKDCLMQMLKVSDKDYSIVSCRRNFIFNGDVPHEVKSFFKNIKSLDNISPNQRNINSKDFCRFVLQNPLHNCIGEPTCVMIRRKAFDTFGVFNAHLNQVCDFELCARIAVSEGIYNIAEPLATFRVHDRSTSFENGKGSNFYRTHILDLLILLHEFSLNPAYEPLRQVSKQLPRPVNISSLFSYKCHLAWKQARRDIDCLKEWEQISEIYPALKTFSKCSLRNQLLYYTKQKKERIKQRIKALS